MAELFGTAASVIQVAEAGFSLATTLYNYAKSVKSAEKDIKKIARDVKLTAKVLRRTHEQLQHDQDAQTCTEEAIHDLEDVLDGCKEAFQEVDEALTKSMRTGPDGKTTISMTEKLKWPLRSSKLEVLRANLEKLKTTLLLMLSVLAYGSKMSQNNRTSAAEFKVELTLEKLQIQNLVQAKDEATQRYEELSQAFSKLETRINASTKSVQGPDHSLKASEVSADSSVPAGTIETNTIATVAMSNSMLPPAEPRRNTLDSSQISSTTRSKEMISAGLGYCASAVSKLATSIDAATKKWQTDQVLEHEPITSSFRNTARAYQILRSHASTCAIQATDGVPCATGLDAVPMSAQPNASHYQDYQVQLKLLEDRNKARLQLARAEQDEMLRRDGETVQGAPDMKSSGSTPPAVAGLQSDAHGMGELTEQQNGRHHEDFIYGLPSSSSAAIDTPALTPASFPSYASSVTVSPYYAPAVTGGAAEGYSQVNSQQHALPEILQHHMIQQHMMQQQHRQQQRQSAGRLSPVRHLPNMPQMIPQSAQSSNVARSAAEMPLNVPVVVSTPHEPTPPPRASNSKSTSIRPEDKRSAEDIKTAFAEQVRRKVKEDKAKQQVTASLRPRTSDLSARVLNQLPNAQCWDHGCNGNQFSSLSDLRRHQRQEASSETGTGPSREHNEDTSTQLRPVELEGVEAEEDSSDSDDEDVVHGLLRRWTKCDPSFSASLETAPSSSRHALKASPLDADDVAEARSHVEELRGLHSWSD